jgi:membrane associated rhomboid family serine protease
MNFLSEIKTRFHRAEGLFRLLLINVTVFLALKLVKLVMFFAGADGFAHITLIDNLAVTSNLPSLIRHPWTFLSYMFVHEGFFHILFNMLILYWLGRIFCEYLGSRKLVPVYIMGGFAGAVLYIAVYNFVPAFADAVAYSRLIGASAGVIAVMVATATLVPNYSIPLLFIGPVKLKYIAVFSIIIYLISIPEGNAGGNIAHLGGALMGFIYTRSLQKGNNPGAWIEKIADIISGKGRPRMKVVNSPKKKSSYFGGTVTQREKAVDEILDKISKSGYSSLSEEEKEILFRASKRK